MQIHHKIALIIPIRLTAATFEGAERLGRICAVVPQDLFEIVISDYGTEPEHRGPIDAAEARGVRVVRHPAPGALFSIGAARDFGVQMSLAPVVLFNDIDFLGTEAMYRAIHAEVLRRRMADNLLDFFCVPVLFLTDEGTRQWLAAPDDAKPFADTLTVDALEADRARIQSVAYGSSAMVVNRHHYLTLGGHDPQFTGHGAEDYDLLHRLSAFAPKGPRPHDYLTDYKDNNVRHYWGFRPFFALHGLDVLPRGLHLVHLAHPRRMEKGYFRPTQNFRLLAEVMQAFDATGGQPMPLPALGTGSGKWFVIYDGGADLETFRQLLPLSTGYELLQATTTEQAARKLETIGTPDGITYAFVTPGVAGDAAALERYFAPAAHFLVMRGPDPDGVISMTARNGAVVATGRLQKIAAPAGAAVLTGWQDLALPGLPGFSSGTVPPARDAKSPLFASFGNERILVMDPKTRPKMKKKSPLLVRFRRWITGY